MCSSHRPCAMELKTAKFLKYKRSLKITTNITALDKHLQGGVTTGKVYELVGNSGMGKTQLCMKLCLNVQMARRSRSRGIAGKSLYFDTRKGFNPARLKEMAGNLLRGHRRRSTPRTTEMLKNVFYVYCPNYAQLIAGIFNCHKRLEKEPKIKLIIVDSMAFAIRFIEDIDERTELLVELHDYMRELQREHDVAVVVINDLGFSQETDRFQLEVKLGEKHSEFINERIWLTEEECFIGKTPETKRLICNLSKWIK